MKGSRHGDQADPVLREPPEDMLPHSMGHTTKADTWVQGQGSTQKGAGRIPGTVEEPRPWRDSGLGPSACGRGDRMFFMCLGRGWGRTGESQSRA